MKNNIQILRHATNIRKWYDKKKFSWMNQEMSKSSNYKTFRPLENSMQKNTY